jgi:predicted metal-dependent peptidase
MKTNTIDPSSFDTNHPLSVAMRLVSRHWFLAYSKLMSLRWEWTDVVPYGATDGARLILNRKGIDKLASKPNGSGLIAFLLVHESLHALLGHGWRLADLKDQHLANVSADYIINAMIAMRNRELKKEVFPLIDGVLLNEELSADKSAEQLYRELCKPKPQQPDNTNQQPQQDDNDQQPQQDNDTNDQQDNDTNDDSDDNSDDNSDEDSKGDDQDNDTGSPDAGDDSDTNSDGSSSTDDLSDFVGTGAADTFEPEADGEHTKEEVIEKAEQDNDRILIADEIDRRTQGLSGDMAKRVAEQRTQSSALRWPELLREWLTKSSRNGWDAPFNAPIFQSTGLASAGRRTRRAGDIVLVLDTSGSVGSATFARFLDEAQAVLDELKPERMHLLSVSHEVADVISLEAGGTVPRTMKGGGGTLFRPAFDWVAKNVDEPDVMVYLTDGCSGDLYSLPHVDYPLLWLSTYTPAHEFKTGEVIMIPAL